jgi:peptide-methionine (S)-S-oxide reductase
MSARSLKRLIPAVAVVAAVLAAAPFALAANGLETAIFAGGCFWTIEKDFNHIPGVVSATSGFDGGTSRHPSYADVAAGKTDYVEAVRVTFDPSKVSYTQLVEDYWRMIDPLDAGGQACDRGASYRSVIFVGSPEQRRVAEASKAALQSGRFSGQVVTAIRDATPFASAGEEQQHFASRHSIEYNRYTVACRRDARLKIIWGGLPR